MSNIVEPVIYNTFPIEIQAYFSEADVTVVKKTARSSVYHMKNQSHDVYLKVTPKEQMQREAIMTSYLHYKGICPSVLHYSSNDNNDYLVTERIPGSHAASDEFIAHPEHLCDVFAESLLHLHQIAHTDCPVTNGLEEMPIIDRTKATTNMGTGNFPTQCVYFSRNRGSHVLSLLYLIGFVCL
ncbi:aminoglycoside 3'-phosphotransferase [Paenibacillus alvei TS-15]|uniref:Aminoglycoside 3'-phosphotransferase n=1 Tax=Paenibacillus alvei TS-15 TaxID=1117108 RepID=S9TNF8_PAEAL|nr:aminoglycoside phosphotransferase APH(3') [Paenibacillus alvei]EPY03856.1 aminoglycoside 3'-phosphotransferase [Paenibacillus alvei TS-15]